MLKATAIVAASLLAGASTLAIADPPQRFAQPQNRIQLDADFQERLHAATPLEESARLQAEHDLIIQQ